MTILSCEDQAKLAVAICATAEALGQTISATAADLMASDLASYQTEVIAAALRACRRELKGKLTLSDILDRIHAGDTRPAEDEAWAIAVQATDEFATVLLTEEMRHALEEARPVLALGDKVGARMAFRAAYIRAVDAARAERRPAKWTPSFGFDPAGRLEALEEGARLGRLPAPEAAAFVAELALTHQPITDDGQAIAGLLTGNTAAPPPSPKIRERWTELAAQVRRNAAEAKARRELTKEQERARLAARKTEALAILTHLQAKQSGHQPELTDG